MIERVLAWFRRKPSASALVEGSVLRRFLDPAKLEADPKAELARVALLVRQAGLVIRLSDGVTLAELEALAFAGEQIADEHALLLLVKSRDFAMALKPYDQGAAVADEILDLAVARHAARCAARNGAG